MHRIERIESILCHLTMDKASCPIITGNHEASQQSTDYPIVHHQRKGTEQLRLSTGGKRRIADISQQVKHHHHQNPPPLIVHTRPSGETSYRKDDSPTKDAILFKCFHRSQSQYAQCQGKEYIVRPIRSIQQVPGQFTDYGKSQQLQKVLHPVSGMLEALCYEEGEHRKGNATEAAHDFVKEHAVLHQVVGTVVCHHGKDGDDLQCATTQ